MNYTKFDFDTFNRMSEEEKKDKRIEKHRCLSPILIEPTLYKDKRGYFFESFNLNEFKKEINQDISFVQDNESLSKKGTLRGLHFQIGPAEQAKLVRVIKGSVYDVAVDIRPYSETFGKYVGVHLTGENHHQFFIPRGFAHGFIALEDDTIFQYKCDNFYNKGYEKGIIYNDPNIGIKWTNYIDADKILLSDKDKNNKYLREFIHIS